MVKHTARDMANVVVLFEHIVIVSDVIMLLYHVYVDCMTNSMSNTYTNNMHTDNTVQSQH